MTREMVRSILKQLGFINVAISDDGKKALDRLRAEHFDLVICDWNMPVFSGIELLRAVRADNKLKNLRFLMLTAEAYRENVVEAAKAGVSDYISKPFTSQTLAEKIAELFTRS